MTDATSTDILDWSKGRPAWQRDALRQLFTTGAIGPEEIDALTELCKSARGLASPRTADVLTKDHLRANGGSTAAVALLSVTHHVGVNALAPEQTVSFGLALTVVYGQNAAGKSGYTRILKRACRSRSTEVILGNVISGGKPLKAQATIRYKDGATEDLHKWHPDLASPAPLTAVSVFDAHSAGVYLRDKTDVAFRPFGLDIFDKLSRVCGEVRFKLESERGKLLATPSNLPSLPEGTRARAIIDGLTALTNVEGVRAIAMLSEQETTELHELRAEERDARSADPKQRARELQLKTKRIESVAKHTSEIERALGTAALKDLAAAAEVLRVAQGALQALRKSVLTADLLPGTGGSVWIEMWEAAREFSRVAYPEQLFPAVTDGARCPFCQQVIGTDAASRVAHLLEYVSSSAQAEVNRADDVFRGKLSSVTSAAVDKPDIELIRTEIAADDPALGNEVVDFLQTSARIQRDVRDAVRNGTQLPTGDALSTPAAKLTAMADSLRKRAEQLKSASPGMSLGAAKELQELEARVVLAGHLKAIDDEVERKKQISVYAQCIDDTGTKPITLKSTELTKKLVTDRLQKTFKDELAGLQFTHLAVEIQSAGGAKGEMFHKLAFTNAPGVLMTEVLSEGESRTLSLAAFLTELSTASGLSGIIFDDPVSSLDHIWRERIANRLIEEAKKRQVIVFTHDLLFLKLLKDGSEQKGVECGHQYVRYSEGQGAGVCSTELPWVAMGVKERIGVLRNRWQAADKLHRTAEPDVYEKDAHDIYGLVRESWEQAIAEVLLNDIVGRYRPSVESKKVRHLHDITPGDCKIVEDEMTECSRWIRGHDQAAANGTPFPKPASLRDRIDALENFTKEIKKRRKSN